MICFPNAKINIGLRILEKRTDGYHNIESVFYPVGWSDILEAIPAEGFGNIELRLSGIPVPGRTNDDNLCVKLYRLVEKDFKLPSLKVWLHKTIPIGAGLGGGSSDAAHFMKILNEMCKLNLTHQQMEKYVGALGSDCVFFINNKPVIATQRGEVTAPIDLNLSQYYIVIVYPDMQISTPFAYGLVKPNAEGTSLKDVVLKKPISDWREQVYNDFEKPLFEKYPLIAEVKEDLYKEGALYAAMTGSGSAVFGIFKEAINLNEKFAGYKIWSGKLK